MMLSLGSTVLTPKLTMDLGELVDEPEALYASTQVAMIACGAHAGNVHTIDTALDRAQRYGCEVGIHPGFADKTNFGRVELALTPPALRDMVRAQCELFYDRVRRRGVAVKWIKFHGALYHLVHRDERAAAAALDAVLSLFSLLEPQLSVVGMRPHCALSIVCERYEVRYVLEQFADRAVRPDGSLVPRSEPNAVLTEELAVRARVTEILAQPELPSLLCLHGDNPSALALATSVRAMLNEHESRR